MQGRKPYDIGLCIAYSKLVENSMSVRHIQLPLVAYR